MKKFLLYAWQLPQHLLGLLVIRLTRAEKAIYPSGRKVWAHGVESLGGVSLGGYVIMAKSAVCWDSVMHEYGHSRQSLRWGPLYLLAVGLPSLCGNVWDRLFHKKWDWEKRRKWYYSRWPEKQADRLGGVEREREG